MSHLAEAGLKHRTIKVYLSAIRFLHIKEGTGDPFQPTLHRLHCVTKKAEAEKGTGEKERLPISPKFLRKIKAAWDPHATNKDIKMLWAACCLSFFAFLQIGEMTVPNDHTYYDRGSHLSFSDVAVDDSSNPRMLRITIKQSKTNPFRKGVDLFVGKTASELCPVRALLN